MAKKAKQSVTAPTTPTQPQQAQPASGGVNYSAFGLAPLYQSAAGLWYPNAQCNGAPVVNCHPHVCWPGGGKNTQRRAVTIAALQHGVGASGFTANTKGFWPAHVPYWVALATALLSSPTFGTGRGANPSWRAKNGQLPAIPGNPKPNVAQFVAWVAAGAQGQGTQPANANATAGATALMGQVRVYTQHMLGLTYQHALAHGGPSAWARFATTPAGVLVCHHGLALSALPKGGHGANCYGAALPGALGSNGKPLAVAS